MVIYEHLLGLVSEVSDILLPTVVIPKKSFVCVCVGVWINVLSTKTNTANPIIHTRFYA